MSVLAPNIMIWPILINCILLYAYGAPNFLMKFTSFAEMGSDVCVDTVVDWDPQVLWCFCLPVTLEPLFNNRWLEPSVQYICSGGHFPNSRVQNTGLFWKIYENQFRFFRPKGSQRALPLRASKNFLSEILGWNEIGVSPTLSCFSWTVPKYGKTYKGTYPAMNLDVGEEGNQLGSVHVVLVNDMASLTKPEVK